MTDNEIIKALDSICNTVTDRLFELSRVTLDLINRQKAEIEQLKIVAGGLEQALKNVTAEVDRLFKECESKEEAYNKEFCLRKELKAEIERLENENKSIRYCYEQAKSYNDTLAESCEKNCKKFNMTTRAESVKEFAERLKEKYGTNSCIVIINNNDIDNLVKEMTENYNG